MNNCIIKTENLGFIYNDVQDDPIKSFETLPGLRDINIEINRGEYISVLGHNGSGKSTFAKLLNLILTPSAGKIYIDGVDITAEDFSEDDVFSVRRKIGMVFQNPDNQLVATVVEEDVAFGPENLGLEREEIRRRVNSALAMVGMTEYAHHAPHKLSGGQKQRVAIAGIIAMRPDVIIFDESTAMLDPLGRKDVMEAIERLNRDKGMTVIMITHYMDEAARADRVIVLDDGRLILDGTPSEVFEEEARLRECGLAIPQCTELIHKLRAAGISLEGECVSLEDCVALIERSLKKQ